MMKMAAVAVLPHSAKFIHSKAASYTDLKKKKLGKSTIFEKR